MKAAIVVLVSAVLCGCSTLSALDTVTDVVKPKGETSVQAQIGAENHQEKSNQLLKVQSNSESKSSDSISTGSESSTPVVGAKTQNSQNVQTGAVQAGTVQIIHNEQPKHLIWFLIGSVCVNLVLGVLTLRSLNKAKV